MMNDEYSYCRKPSYGTCSTCKRYNTYFSWCRSCDPTLLTKGWTSGIEIIDELIKSTQLETTKYDNNNYLEWIPYKDLKDFEKIGQGGFATIYRATWLNGKKYIDYKTRKRCCED